MLKQKRVEPNVVFLMQIFTDAALKILAMRQHYSAFCLASAKICYSKTASHQKGLFFRAVWCFFSEIILSYNKIKSAAMCGKTRFFGTSGSNLFCLFTGLFERLFKVGDYVANVLNSDGETDEVAFDAAFLKLFFGQLTVSH